MSTMAQKEDLLIISQATAKRYLYEDAFQLQALPLQASSGSFWQGRVDSLKLTPE